MGFMKWFAKKGSIGDTARAVAKGWLTLKKRYPEMDPNEIADAYIEIRYGLTSEEHLAENVLLSYNPTPTELTWSLLLAENENEIATVYENEEIWKEIIRDEIKKCGLDPDDTW